MRHLKKLDKLGLKKSHRDSLLKNLISSLIMGGKIKTTLSRAKALASRFEKMMTLVRKKNKREAIRLMPNYCFGKEASNKITNVLKIKYEKRNSGLTRITKIGMRKGDNAEYVQIELI